VTTTIPRSVGDVVGGRFRLASHIGSGGVATVWEAIDETTGAIVALKLPRRPDEETLGRLRREHRVARALDHPALVGAIELVEIDDGGLALVQPRLQGENLAAFLARRRVLEPRETATLFAPIARALELAHENGIIHRDIKPANVFVVSDGTEPPARLLDFGATKLTAKTGDVAATNAWTVAGSTLGSPLYMSPEQVFGDTIDARTDCWSLGVVLFECLSGRRPVEAPTLVQTFRLLLAGAFPPLESVAPDVPRELSTLVGRLLDADLERRTTSAADVAAVLESLR
jgi:serine/threonine protein kinase